MKKVSYIGNDETTIFYFSFPYYEKSNIVVTVNGAAASGVEVVGNPGGINADFPFIGGHIAFDFAPGDTDVITISRVLPLSRVVDYQQMVQIDPKTLNMDMNYIKQVLDDLNEELDEIQETTDTDKLNEVKQKIDAKIATLGDISTLRTDVSTNSENITAVNVRTMGMTDYVIESQTPTSQNNYTWYRKYKSGWVEQGGKYNALPNNSQKTVPLPIAIQNRNVGFAQISCTQTGFNSQDTLSAQISTDGLSIELYQKNAGSAAMSICWEACGICAE